MNYRVGQVLYVILKEKTMIFPMQVVEEITKKTLSGEVTNYMVRAGTKDGTISLSEVNGEIFDSAEKAKDVLMARVTAGINAKVKEAVDKAREWYPTGFEQASEDPLSLIKKTGVVAESAPAAQHASRPVRNEVAELAAELKQEADQAVVELPGGIKARVRNVKMPPELS